VINKNKNDTLQGQISIYDLEFAKPQKTKGISKPISITKPKEHDDKFTEIINLYSSTAARIVKQVCGALLVEVEDKTLYFNPAGINELVLKKDMELMPADEILIVNLDREVNEQQLKKLEDMQVTQYIKRKGDANIMVPFPGKLIIINPRGWVLEYLQKPKYKADELFTTEKKGEIKLEIGDKVEFNYDGPQVGNITSIYNNGETVNVVWDHKHTAFYYKYVKKMS
jgi:hypothetical protein